jgi:beta-N-acetylhexosaminidase
MSLGPVMAGIAGLELQPDEREMLLHPLTGGVILFSRNYESLPQLEALTREIRSLREPRLLVAVDHEGGRVQRFRKGFTSLPAVRRLGNIYDDNPGRARLLSELSGWLMAIELVSVGIDISFAPVLDLDKGISHVIGDRAFHGNPEVVADLAHAYMRGMNNAGMAATGKHFPGHGSVEEDSHVAVPLDHRRYEDILMEDMVPFERMIHYGMAAVMIAHVIYDRLDKNPAGFSSFWLTEVLRKQLGFQGVIFSDDLEMAGAEIAGNMPERARLALSAGCDMVLVCKDYNAVTSILDNITEWNSPASQLRLARMHCRQRITRSMLQKDTKWQHAVKEVEAYDIPHTLNLV